MIFPSLFKFLPVKTVDQGNGESGQQAEQSGLVRGPAQAPENCAGRSLPRCAELTKEHRHLLDKWLHLAFPLVTGSLAHKG